MRFGLFPVRSPLLGESLVYFLFLGVLRCFSSPRLPLYPVVKITSLQLAGLSHSEIRGSKDICSYPRLIAAYHVLHRLREPRHPPDALTFFRHLLIPIAGNKVAHTISCNLEINYSVSKNKVFITYSLVCQYVKDLCENPSTSSLQRLCRG